MQYDKTVKGQWDVVGRPSKPSLVGGGGLTCSVCTPAPSWLHGSAQAPQSWQMSTPIACLVPALSAPL